MFGKTWVAPLVNGMGHANASGTESEPWIFSLLQRIHSKTPIDIFIDIGVNTGQTLIKIKSIDKDINYIGFEPNPNCIFYVDYLVKLNKLKKVNLICVALGQRVEFLELKYEGLDDTRSTLIDTEKIFQNGSYVRKVPVVPLDNVDLALIQESHIVMKIDVEGFEYEVLKGADLFLKSFHPLLIFEVLPNHDDQIIAERQENLYHYLVNNQYTIYCLESGDILGKCIHGFTNKSDYSKTDYVAFPKDTHFQAT